MTSALRLSTPDSEPSAPPPPAAIPAEAVTPTIQPLPALLSPAELAELLHVSVRQLRRWSADGTVPVPPIKTGRIVHFRTDAILRWIAHDCPPRDTWLRLHQAEQSRA